MKFPCVQELEQSIHSCLLAGIVLRLFAFEIALDEVEGPDELSKGVLSDARSQTSIRAQL